MAVRDQSADRPSTRVNPALTWDFAYESWARAPNRSS